MGYIVPPPPPSPYPGNGFPYLVISTPYRTASFAGETPDEFFKAMSITDKVEIKKVYAEEIKDVIKEPNWDNGFEVI